MAHLKDYNAFYKDGSMGGAKGLPENLSVGARMIEGYHQGMKDAESILAQITNSDGLIVESIKVITHSMGGAYAKGYVKALIKYLKQNGYDRALISLIADFDPFQAASLEAEENIKTQQFTHKKSWDGITSFLANQRQKNLPDEDYHDDKNKGNHSVMSFFNDISKLEEGTYIWDGNNWVLQKQ